MICNAHAEYLKAEIVRARNTAVVVNPFEVVSNDLYLSHQGSGEPVQALGLKPPSVKIAEINSLDNSVREVAHCHTRLNLRSIFSGGSDAKRAL